MSSQAGDIKAPVGGTIKGAIYITLLFLQLIMLPWFLTQAAYWSDVDIDLEEITLASLLDLPLLLQLAIPLILSPVVIILLVRFKQHPRVKAVFDHGLLYVGIICQLVLDWLFYAQVHRIFPFSSPDLGYLGGGEIPTGWLSSETMPLTLFTAWLYVTGLLVIPVLVGILSRKDPRGQEFKQSWHLGAGILGLLLALRWGGPWTAPLQHLIYTAGCLPVLVYLSYQPDKVLIQDQVRAPSHVQFIGSLGLNFLLAWWFTVLELQSGSLLSLSWLWAVPAGANIAVFILNRSKKSPWETTQRGMLVSRILWIILITCTMLTILGSLNSFFTLSRTAWLTVGLGCSGFFPEFHHLLRRDGSRVMAVRLFFGIFFLLIFGILPYLANIYDPITSYAGLGLVVIFGTGSLLLFRVKRDQQVTLSKGHE